MTMSVHTARPAARLAFSSIGAMVAALRAREVSAVELTRLHIERIERLDPKINAVVVRDFDRALAVARAADAERAAGDDRPLLGVPITIKDNLNVAGLRTTSGIPARSGVPVAERDATVVGRLRAAGAVIMGKTNLPPAASDYQTTNPIFGRTGNPYDVSRTPGGSTGGGAAAVSAGLSPLDIGTDIGGSIRVPAAYCGIFGHKPSETVVARDGQMADFPVANPGKVGNVQGPLARDPGDLELVLGLIAGPSGGDEVAWRLELPPPRRTVIADLRVAFLPPIPWLPLASAIGSALESLAQRLARIGARVATRQPEVLGDMKDMHLRYMGLAGATLSPAMPLERIEAIASRTPSPTADALGAGLITGIRASARDYLTWLDDRDRYRASYRAFFEEWDLLVAPVSPVTAFPHDDRSYELREILVDGQAAPYGRLGTYPAIASIAGCPATVIPLGRDADGLPVGVQLIGPYLEDRTPLRAASLIARELGGYVSPSGFD